MITGIVLAVAVAGFLYHRKFFSCASETFAQDGLHEKKRRSLRNPIRCDQAAAAAFRQPGRPNAPRPVAHRTAALGFFTLAQLNGRMIGASCAARSTMLRSLVFSRGTFALSPRHPRIVRIHINECSCRLRVPVCQWPHGAVVQLSNRHASILSAAISMSHDSLSSSTGPKCWATRHTAVFSSAGNESKFRAV
jgi:hypothetical protein